MQPEGREGRGKREYAAQSATKKEEEEEEEENQRPRPRLPQPRYRKAKKERERERVFFFHLSISSPPAVDPKWGNRGGERREGVTLARLREGG